MGLAAQTAAHVAHDAHMAELTDAIMARADTACVALGPAHRDTLCCGNLSLSEYLVSRGNLRGAGRLLAGIVARAQTRGHYTFLHSRCKPVDEPGLFNGLAGVGYGLLRHADPSLPSLFV